MKNLTRRSATMLGLIVPGLVLLTSVAHAEIIASTSIFDGLSNTLDDDSSFGPTTAFTQSSHNTNADPSFQNVFARGDATTILSGQKTFQFKLSNESQITEPITRQTFATVQWDDQIAASGASGLHYIFFKVEGEISIVDGFGGQPEEWSLNADILDSMGMPTGGAVVLVRDTNADSTLETSYSGDWHATTAPPTNFGQVSIDATFRLPVFLNQPFSIRFGSFTSGGNEGQILADLTNTITVTSITDEFGAELSDIEFASGAEFSSASVVPEPASVQLLLGFLTISLMYFVRKKQRGLV